MPFYIHINARTEENGDHSRNAAGVEVLAGTDVVKPLLIPGPSLHLELSLLVQAGLTNMEALEAATLAPPQERPRAPTEPPPSGSPAWW